MDIFEQTKTSDIPYVDWMAEDEQAGVTGLNAPLPFEIDGAARPRGPLSARRGGGGGGVPWSKSFLNRAVRFDPSGAFLKFLSLAVAPLLFTAGAYLLFRVYLGWSRYPTSAVLLLVFFLVLKHAVARLAPRPSFRDVLEFVCQEVALAWLMWIIGSLFYTLTKHNLGVFAFESVNTFVGLVAAGVAYFIAAKHVTRRKGARGAVRHLFQAGLVGAANFAGTVAGFFLAPVLWEPVMQAQCPPHGHYVMAMIFAFATFWIAVNQFYIEENTPNHSTSRRERGTDMEIG